MADAILVSICIPAYKRSDYLNPVALGTPANWNQAISKAGGQWIKLMHDDDWFTDENSLQQFANAIEINSSASFIFSAYRNVYLASGQTQNVFADTSRFRMLQKNPVTLFSRNIIGPPSTVIHKKNNSILYDERLKWLVDIDFYMRYLGAEQPSYINGVLVNIGIGEKQVTQTAFGNKTVEIPEYFLLLQKTGIKALRNILVFDAWWRFIRNMNIQSKEDVSQSGYQGPVPDAILTIIHFQNKIPRKLLQVGPMSKSFMLLSYLSVKRKLV
jgi:glycosyltransferase involved in cell wall biosynthesis